MMTTPLARRLAAEAVGTAVLTATVVGSGIQAEAMSADGGVRLLGSVLASVLALAVLIALLAPVAVAGWILAACWGTSSGSFANPALTFGRALSDSYAGIAPGSVPAFVLAQAAGALAGLVLAAVVFGTAKRAARNSDGAHERPHRI